ncbi:hypothetical protein [Wenjunlia tyrosinilytica]|uniref:hypothetical protein n=1 Tax=Wenjunlia tyrosinilytica TaxID=1544741 RepID=UPI001663117A|nr:hypothetical protein [Wenjunlia tyrosinilytica]
MSAFLHEQFGDPPTFGPDRATILLPIGDFPKVSQVDLTFTVAGERVHRVSRKENGEIQARYFRRLAERTPVRQCGVNRLDPLLTAIFTFDPTALKGELNNYKRPFRHPLLWWQKMGRKTNPGIKYVKKAIDRGVRDETVFNHCHQVAEDIGSFIEGYMLSTDHSAAEYPLLALPELFRNHPHMTERDALKLLRRLRLLLRQAKNRAAADNDAAKSLLYTYFSYGRRWEAFARCEIPLNEHFLIEVREKREVLFNSPKEERSRLAWLGTWFCDRIAPRVRQYVAFADAESNHVNIRVDDTSVQLGFWGTGARDETYSQIPSTERPDAEHRTREYYSRYDSKAARRRPDSRMQRLWIECRLLPTWMRLFMGWGFIVATWSAIYLVVRLGFAGCEHLTTSDVLAILFPVTFASSLLLVQDTTTLGRHIKRAKQSLLLFFLLALWGLVFALYVMGRIKVGLH